MQAKVIYKISYINGASATMVITMIQSYKKCIKLLEHYEGRNTFNLHTEESLTHHLCLRFTIYNKNNTKEWTIRPFLVGTNQNYIFYQDIYQCKYKREGLE